MAACTSSGGSGDQRREGRGRGGERRVGIGEGDGSRVPTQTAFSNSLCFSCVFPVRPQLFPVSIYISFGKISKFPVFSLTGIFFGPFSLFSLCSGYPDTCSCQCLISAGPLPLSHVHRTMSAPGQWGVVDPAPHINPLFPILHLAAH